MAVIFFNRVCLAFRIFFRIVILSTQYHLFLKILNSNMALFTKKVFKERKLIPKLSELHIWPISLFYLCKFRRHKIRSPKVMKLKFCHLISGSLCLNVLITVLTWFWCKWCRSGDIRISPTFGWKISWYSCIFWIFWILLLLS